MLLLCLCDFGVQKYANYFQCRVERNIIANNKVGGVFVVSYVAFVGGHYVVFVAIEHVVQVVAALYLVAQNAAFYLNVVLCLYEQF